MADRKALGLKLPQGAVWVGDHLFCLRESALTGTLAALRRCGFVTHNIADELSVNDRPLPLPTDPRRLAFVQRYRWSAVLRGNERLQCKACNELLDDPALTDPHAVCNHCARPLQQTVQVGQSIRFSFIEMAQFGEFGGTVAHCDDEALYFQIPIDLPKLDAHGHDTLGHHIIRLCETAMVNGRNCYRMTRELIDVSRNYRGVYVWKGAAYRMDNPAAYPVPRFLYVHEAWRWAPLAESELLMQMVLLRLGFTNFEGRPAHVGWQLAPGDIDAAAELLQHLTEIPPQGLRMLVKHCAANPVRLGQEILGRYRAPAK